MATDQSLNTENGVQPKPFVLAPDPNRAMQQMMDVIDSLRDVYLKENEALKSSDTKGFLSLQDEKIDKARQYQNGSQQLLERKDDLQHIDLALKEQLVAKQEEFSGIMAENLKALDRTKKSIQRLNDRVVKSAREAARTNNANYGSSGNLHQNERSVSMGVSETV